MIKAKVLKSVSVGLDGNLSCYHEFEKKNNAIGGQNQSLADIGKVIDQGKKGVKLRVKVDLLKVFERLRRGGRKEQTFIPKKVYSRQRDKKKYERG